MMLDMKFLRSNFEEIKKKLEHRGEDLTDFDQFVDLDKKRRELIVTTEELKSKRNEVSSKIAELKKRKERHRSFNSRNASSRRTHQNT